MKRFSITLVIIPLIIFSFCSLPNQPGPMPKELVKTEFEPSLNLFGILIADETHTRQSFVYVQRILTVDEVYSDQNPLISTAEVIVREETDSLLTEPYYFTPVEDTLQEGYYYNFTFRPTPGKTYHLTVSDSGFPVVYGKTNIPPPVVIDSIFTHDNILKLSLSVPDSVFMVEISIVLNEAVHKDFIYPEEQGNYPLSFELPENFHGTIYVQVAGFDRNYAYYSSQSIGIIPQTYHEPVTTLENGYGVFGSVSISSQEVTVP